jgi:type IV pilus assembly protein PilW
MNTPNPATWRQAGFSLIELMIAMTIGLVLMAALGYVMLGAKTSFSTLDALSRMQENARVAFDTMAKDIRMAGFTGGPANGGSPRNLVNNPAANTWDPGLKDLHGIPLRGHEEGGTFPTGVTALRGDALTVVRADNESELALASVVGNCSGTTVCTLEAWPASGAPEAGEILVAADYTHTAVFQATAVAAGARTVSHGTGSGTPGNLLDDLGPFNGDAGARKLYRLSGATYYIANNPNGDPTLFRHALGHTGTTATATDTEVAEGVESMQIKYGVDTDVTADKAVNCYWSADNVASGGPAKCPDDDDAAGTSTTLPGANAQERWQRVLSVRVTLDLVSRQDTHVTITGDGLLRKSLTNTISVRNRLL